MTRQKNHSLETREWFHFILSLSQSTGIHRYHPLLFRPERKMEQGLRRAAQARPFDVAHLTEIGGSESEGASEEQDAAARLVPFPQSASVRAGLTPFQQFTMLIYVSKSQDSVLSDDEFLIHN